MLLAVVLFLTLLVVIYKWMESGFREWEARGMPMPIKPYPIIGTLRWKDFKALRHAAETVPETYNDLSGHKYTLAFLFTKPIVMIRDPELIREIGIKAAGEHFMDRTTNQAIMDIHPEISRMLTMLTGDEWKQVRAGISPAFTTGKLKNVAVSMVKSGRRLQDYIIRERTKAADGLIEGKALVGQYALSIVGESVYGVSNIDAFAEEESDFIKHCKNTSFKMEGIKALYQLFYLIVPGVMKALNLKILDSEAFHYLADVTKGILKQRRETNYKGKDMIQVMLDLQAKQMQKNAMEETEELDDFEKDAELKGIKNVSMDEETLIQSTTLFLIAGFDTVGTTLSLVLYYLAVSDSEIQERVQREVDDIADNLEEQDELTYEDFSSMTYMEQVIHETMRIAPAAAAVDRMCTKDYRMPDGGIIPKGTTLFFLTMGIMMDPQYFPDPEKFDPERWTPENKANIKQYTQLGFGFGPRNCVGMRFAMLEMKTCLFYILRKFNVCKSEKTVYPPKWDPRSLLTAPLGGNWLKFEDRT